jgi:hypothetical protein
MARTQEKAGKLSEQPTDASSAAGMRGKPTRWRLFAFLIIALLVVWLLYRGFQTMRFGAATAIRLPGPVASLALDDASGAVLVSHWKRSYASLVSLASRGVGRVPLSERVREYDPRWLPPSVAISRKGWGAVVTSDGMDVLDLKKKQVVRHFLGPVNVASFDPAGDVLYADMRTIKMPEAKLVESQSAAGEFFSSLAAHDKENKFYANVAEAPSAEKQLRLVFGKLDPQEVVRTEDLKGALTPEEVAVVPGGLGAVALIYSQQGTQVRFVPADPKLPVRTVLIPGKRPWDPSQGIPRAGDLSHRRLYPHGKDEVVIVRDDKHCLLVDLRAGKHVKLPFGADDIALSAKSGKAIFGKGRSLKLWPIPQRDSKGVLRVPSTNRPIF